MFPKQGISYPNPDKFIMGLILKPISPSMMMPRPIPQINLLIFYIYRLLLAMHLHLLFLVLPLTFTALLTTLVLFIQGTAPLKSIFPQIKFPKMLLCNRIDQTLQKPKHLM